MSKEPEQTLSKAEINALAARFKSGDADAFDQLVLTFQRPIFNLAYRMLNSYEDASDMTQEIFVKVHRSISRFRGESSFSTWLYTVAANTCRNQIRTMVRRRSVEVTVADRPDSDESDFREPVATDKALTPDRHLERRDMVQNVEKILAGIPPDFAMVLVMKDMQDMQYEEIAAALNCSMGTVKSRLSRARIMVKDKLTPLLS